MSGGSFNYLYSLDASELDYAKGEDLDNMISSLRRRGFVDAAEETYGILLDWQAFQFRTDARIKRLADIWHAVEWHESCDSGPEGVDRAIAAYRGIEIPPLPEGHRDIVRGMCECGDYCNRCPARVKHDQDLHRMLGGS